MTILHRFASGPKLLRADVPNSPQSPTHRRGFLATLVAALGLAARPAVAEAVPAVPPRLAHECQFHGSPMRLEVLPPGREHAPLVGVEKLLDVRDLALGTGWRLAIVALPFTRADEDEMRKWASDRGYDPDRFCPRGSMAGQLP